MTEEKKYTQRCSLIKIKEKFAEKGFTQINKSTLLRLAAITHIDLNRNLVNLEQGNYSLSRNY